MRGLHFPIAVKRLKIILDKMAMFGAISWILHSWENKVKLEYYLKGLFILPIPLRLVLLHVLSALINLIVSSLILASNLTDVSLFSRQIIIATFNRHLNLLSGQKDYFKNPGKKAILTLTLSISLRSQASRWS